MKNHDLYQYYNYKFKTKGRNGRASGSAGFTDEPEGLRQFRAGATARPRVVSPPRSWRGACPTGDWSPPATCWWRRDPSCRPAPRPGSRNPDNRSACCPPAPCRAPGPCAWSCPDDLFPVAHVDVVIRDDHELGVGELTQGRPHTEHDAPGVAGIAFFDAHAR